VSINSELYELHSAGVDVSCRCPKPCMPHSNHYRNEELAKVRKAKKRDFVYVVSYDHPSYAHGVQAVWTSREAALEDIDKSIVLEGFNRKRDFKRTHYPAVSRAITTYAGVGNADGIYYYITRLRIG